MISIKVGDAIYPATIVGVNSDPEWDSRATNSITLDGFTFEEVKELLHDNVEWGILMTTPNPFGEETENYYDHSEYCYSGPITDHRNGKVTIKMGKMTEAEEATEILLNVLSSISEEEYNE